MLKKGRLYLSDVVKQKKHKDYGGARVAKRVQFQGVLLGRDDLVFVDGGAAIVEACVRDSSTAGLSLLARPLERVARGHAWSEWSALGQALSVVPLRIGGPAVVTAYAWARSPAGVLALHSF